MGKRERGEGILSALIPRLRGGIDTILDAGLDRLGDAGDNVEGKDDDGGEEDAAHSIVVRQQKVLQALALPPLVFGTVLNKPVEVEGDPMSSIVVALQEGRQMAVKIAKDLVVSPGDWVALSSQSFHVVERRNEIPCGPIARVKAALDNGKVEVDINGSMRTVLAGAYKDRCIEGDCVVLDPASAIIVCNLGNSAQQYAFTGSTDVSWDDICGVDEAKDALQEMIELPQRGAKVFARYKLDKHHAKGALLLGPSGCGKTLCLKAAATAMVALNDGKGRESAFILVSGPEILSRYVGDIEATVRMLFRLARQHFEKYGYPAVIAIEEAEALLKRRGSGRSSDVETTVVPMFLAEMDGLKKSGAIVILTTNRPDAIDPAILRDKRIDRKIEVGRPTRESALLIFKKILKDVPLKECTFDELATFGVEEIFSERHRLHALSPRQISLDQGKPETSFLTLAHLINGAMVDGVATKAIMRAVRREIDSQKEDGVTKGDIAAAIEMTVQDNRRVNHDEELQGLAQKLYPGASVDILPPEQFQSR